MRQLLIVSHSIAQPAVAQEYGAPIKRVAGIALASQIDLLIGAAVWGFSADIIGRRPAFDTSLFVYAIFVWIAASMPSYTFFAAMYARFSLRLCSLS